MRTSHVLSMILLLAMATASAQENGEAPAARVEVTPFLGYRAGGTFDVPDSTQNADVSEHISYGFALDYRVDEGASYALFFSRQPTQVRVGGQPEHAGLEVEYLMVGGTLVIEEMSVVSPYIIALIGLGRLTLDAPLAEETSRLAVALGVGLRVPMREHLDLRLETRGYVTFVNSDSSLFCPSTSVEPACQLRGNGSLFPQFEVALGVAWSF